MRDTIPENNVASMQEELAAVKLREAEANLALKDLKAKVKYKFEEIFFWNEEYSQVSTKMNGLLLAIVLVLFSNISFN